MSHPFEVGKTYRNRSGEYVVKEIEGDRMTIRYADGRSLVTNVRIQARIWENIQFEKQMAMAEERRRQAQEARREVRQRKARAKRERAKPTFDGFEESDFEPKKRGIAWSGRQELGRVLAYDLAQRTDEAFEYQIVPRRSKVHVARKGQYDKGDRETNAAFFVSVDEDGVSYGFRVGKPSGKVQPDWPWSILLATLADSEDVREVLHSVLDEHGLSLDVYALEMGYGQVGQIASQGDEFLWRREDAEQEVTRPMNGEEVAGYLQTLAPDKQCDLYVRNSLPVDAALERGAEVANEIATVFEALLPLYDASAGA
jgi:hypothetical protein